MSQHDQLKRLVDRVLKDPRFCGDEHHLMLATGVSALIAENERLNKSLVAASGVNSAAMVCAKGFEAERDQLKAENEIFEEGMRSLASNLGAGGYNAETLTATQLVEKVKWGVDHLANTSARMIDELRSEIVRLQTDNEGLTPSYEEVQRVCMALSWLGVVVPAGGEERAARWVELVQTIVSTAEQSKMLRQDAGDILALRKDADRYRGVRRVANSQGWSDDQFDNNTDQKIERFDVAMGIGKQP
ncbi:hypothetical protein HZF02_32680 (plasmid) [Pseudomonas yamanorum]|nr:hypothetical protein HZF02_32680 [Pseudomonas yamanorum]